MTGRKDAGITMKLITVALLLNAIAELIAASAKFFNVIRHRK